MSITPTIDLRATHGRARQQGQRKTCLAFALSDLNGHRHSRPAQLSPEHLYREAAAHMPGWKPDGGLTLEAALRAVSAPGQALEAAVPYQDADPPLPLAPNPACDPLFPGLLCPLHNSLVFLVKGGSAETRIQALRKNSAGDCLNRQAFAARNDLCVDTSEDFELTPKHCPGLRNL